MWRLKKGKKICGNFANIAEAKEALIELRELGLNGFIWRVN